MNPKESYDHGLISIGEFAEKAPAEAIDTMRREFDRQIKNLRSEIVAMQKQLDAITDMVYDSQ